MFDRIRLVVNHPVVKARIRQITIAAFLVVLALIGLAIVQFKTGKWPFDRPVVVQDKSYRVGSETEVLEAQLQEGEVEELLVSLGEKRFDWQGTIAELAQDVEDRRKIALRIMELPSTKPYELDIAKSSLMRALIDRQTIRRHSDTVDAECTNELIRYIEEYSGENEQLTRLCAAANSMLAIGKILDSNPGADDFEELFGIAVDKIDKAADVNRDDVNITTTHFFWTDWVRSHIGDKKSLPLIDALTKHYSESEVPIARENAKKLLRSLELGRSFWD